MPGVKAEPATERGPIQTRGIEWPNFSVGKDHNAYEPEAEGVTPKNKLWFADIHLRIQFKKMDGNDAEWWADEANRLAEEGTANSLNDLKTLLLRFVRNPNEPAVQAMIDALQLRK